jgi:prepilin peptidase CpaA
LLAKASDPIVLLIAGSGLAVAAIDLRTRRVPNAATGGIAALGLLLAAAHLSRVSIAGALAGCVLGFLLMLPGHLIGGTGAGDVKLFAAVGTLLGPSGVLLAFVYTAIAGGVLAAAVAFKRRLLTDSVARVATLVGTAGSNVRTIEADSINNRFAYAPAIAVGALLAALRV